MKLNRFLSLAILIFLMILSMMVFPAIAQQGKKIENILPNPDFETDTNGWSIGAGNTFQIDKKEKAPFAGYNVVKATVDVVGANAWEPEIHSPSFPLINGKKYTYAFWAKTEQGKTRTLSCRFEQLDTWVGIGRDELINDQWKEYFFTGVWTHPSSPPNVVIHIALNVQPNPLADVWFFHFRVYEGDYVEEQLGGKPKAVNHSGSLATTWGKIKQ